MMRGERDEIPPGTLEMLILTTLATGPPRHGFEIAESILSVSEDVLQVEEGSLYPALQRMLLKGWIQGDWGKTDENRRARFYRLTAGSWTAKWTATGAWRGRSRAYSPRRRSDI
jgi:transcriptional regulator